MNFVRAEIEEIPEIMKIIKAAQKYLKEQGIDQWQNNYPNPETLKKDIEAGNSYIIKKEGKIIAVAAVIFGEDPTYNLIEEGSWLADGLYGVIHRAAVAPEYKGQGIISIIYRKTFKMGANLGADSIRIDTHQDNLAMRRAIEKAGFNYCGIIYTKDGSPRLAYEKLIQEGSN
ncbi:RimJ/RimL family protein N-acetyltransferase [Halanaerobium saccharolyticum]|jgi:RimJ/RimL family protein N-acetyltransferase|uniref:RimJ/RimL family protein N-acetyltransferase n=1 Tax=Halanaerobium saccharolyticum TaxID=43595 RepID=A0A2T5RRN8_9FIRM|nr:MULTISPECIES: GNAT family N-acetyltransferase [Halanaerobium]PTW02778.1 RimJ/RimL family protein N-acetyltransferase [Halanaerobium saccharolyticum]PUU88037.1 MAG: acetyltransferase [Halanaerobium sp.]PUU90274.1 MAG: acetyltransferase [Halanaerobium sp.]